MCAVRRRRAGGSRAVDRPRRGSYKCLRLRSMSMACIQEARAFTVPARWTGRVVVNFVLLLLVRIKITFPPLCPQKLCLVHSRSSIFSFHSFELDVCNVSTRVMIRSISTQQGS
ncbi:unnamed protein product [Victoria cruziana]